MASPPQISRHRMRGQRGPPIPTQCLNPHRLNASAKRSHSTRDQSSAWVQRPNTAEGSGADITPTCQFHQTFIEPTEPCAVGSLPTRSTTLRLRRPHPALQTDPSWAVMGHGLSSSATLSPQLSPHVIHSRIHSPFHTKYGFHIPAYRQAAQMSKVASIAPESTGTRDDGSKQGRGADNSFLAGKINVLGQTKDCKDQC